MWHSPFQQCTMESISHIGAKRYNLTITGHAKKTLVPFTISLLLPLIDINKPTNFKLDNTNPSCGKRV